MEKGVSTVCDVEHGLRVPQALGKGVHGFTNGRLARAANRAVELETSVANGSPGGGGHFAIAVASGGAAAGGMHGLGIDPKAGIGHRARPIDAEGGDGVRLSGAIAGRDDKGEFLVQSVLFPVRTAELGFSGGVVGGFHGVRGGWVALLAQGKLSRKLGVDFFQAGRAGDPPAILGEPDVESTV